MEGSKMGNFDPNYKRLGIILILFITLTVLYACEFAFFVSAPSDVVGSPMSTGTDTNYYNESKIEEGGLDLIGFFQFITFTIPEIPSWMVYFVSPFSVLLNIILGYLIADVIYDIVKALPFT